MNPVRPFLIAALLLLASVLASATPVVVPTEASAKPVMNWSPPRLVHPGLGLQFNWGSDISCPTEGFCASAGEHGNVLVSTEPAGGAAAWEVLHVDSTAANELNGISCPTESFCAAVDWGGSVVTSTEPSDEASWSGAPVDSGSHFTDISCPSAHFCAAVDRDGRIFTSSEPTGGARAWHFAPGVSGGEFRSISCASASFCAAVRLNEGFGGDVVTSTNPSGGPWTAAGLEVHGRPEGISCPSASFCAAILGEGTFVSTNPTGGASAWHRTKAGNDPSGISCPTENFCAAVNSGGSVVASTEPSSETAGWEETDITPTTELIQGISCPTSGFCAAVDRPGDIYWSTEPAAESPAWQIADTGSSDVLLSSVACPASSFCAATGVSGNLYTTTDPLGSGSWEVGSPYVFASLENELWDLSCASASWCVALGSDPEPLLFYSTEPSGGMEAWHSVNRPRGVDISCPTSSFCAMANGTKEVLTSTEPLGGAETWAATDTELPDWRLGGNSIHDISCASENLCAAGGDVGMVVSSTDPTGGSSAWAKAFVGDPADYYHGAGPSVDGIDCPNDGFCAATTWGSTVSTTSKPAGGSAAWSVSQTQTGATYFLGPISCTESASLCVAVDHSGRAASSFTPNVASESWGSTQLVDSLAETTAVSCVPEGAFCLAVDGSGYAVLGTPEEEVLSQSGSGGGGPSPTPALPSPPHKHHCKRTQKGKAKRMAITSARRISNGGRRSKSRCGRLR